MAELEFDKVVEGIDFDLFKCIIPHLPMQNQLIKDRVVDSILMNTAEYKFKLPLQQIFKTIGILCSPHFTDETE